MFICQPFDRNNPNNSETSKDEFFAAKRSPKVTSRTPEVSSVQRQIEATPPIKPKYTARQLLAGSALPAPSPPPLQAKPEIGDRSPREDIFFKKGRDNPRELTPYPLTPIARQNGDRPIQTKSELIQRDDDEKDDEKNGNNNNPPPLLSELWGTPVIEEEEEEKTELSQELRQTAPDIFHQSWQNQDWSPEMTKEFMMEKQLDRKGKPNLAKQNQANASIWYNTLFSSGVDTPDYDSEQERVLQEQQAMLKRHFLAQAVFGVQGGTQHKNKTLKSNKSENYRSIESLQQDGISPNLATLASGGGRFNYRSEDGSGKEFDRFLLFGDRKNKENIEDLRADTNKTGGQMPTSYLGSYERNSTHGSSFNKGVIREENVLLGQSSTGFDIPIGGVGQDLVDLKGRPITTGYQGVSTTQQRGKDNTTTYQTGHMLHDFSEQNNLGLTQLAFEGSAPWQKNIFGESHQLVDTVKKKLHLKSSKFTLTGQSKRKKLELPKGKGGVKTDVNYMKLGQLEKAYAALEELRNSDDPELKKMEKTYYKRLLTSTTQDERDEIVEELLERKKQSELKQKLMESLKQPLTNEDLPQRSGNNLEQYNQVINSLFNTLNQMDSSIPDNDNPDVDDDEWEDD